MLLPTAKSLLLLGDLISTLGIFGISVQAQWSNGIIESSIRPQPLVLE